MRQSGVIKIVMKSHPAQDLFLDIWPNFLLFSNWAATLEYTPGHLDLSLSFAER